MRARRLRSIWWCRQQGIIFAFFACSLSCQPTCALHCLQVWETRRYKKIGFETWDYVTGEDGAVGLIQATVGGRANHLSGIHNVGYKFTVHPAKRKSDSQVCHFYSERIDEDVGVVRESNRLQHIHYREGARLNAFKQCFAITFSAT